MPSLTSQVSHLFLPAIHMFNAAIQWFNAVSSSGLNTEQMLLKDMKVVSGILNLAVSVLYVTLEVRISQYITFKQMIV